MDNYSMASHHNSTQARPRQTTALHAAAPPSNRQGTSKRTKEDRQVTRDRAIQRSKETVMSSVLFYVPNLIGKQLFTVVDLAM